MKLAKEELLILATYEAKTAKIATSPDVLVNNSVNLRTGSLKN